MANYHLTSADYTQFLHLRRSIVNATCTESAADLGVRRSQKSSRKCHCMYECGKEGKKSPIHPKVIPWVAEACDVSR